VKYTVSNYNAIRYDRVVSGGMMIYPTIGIHNAIEPIHGDTTDIGTNLFTNLTQSSCNSSGIIFNIETGIYSIDEALQTDIPEEKQFFYHSDHLRSSSFITDILGDVDQFTQYMPYGELLVDQRSSGHDIRYKFTGKERDEETGLDYFGARYYASDISVWLSVDPMSDKYPSMSPYMYTAGNPVMLVDPDGREIVDGNGHAVTISSPVKQKDGSYTTAFKFAKGTSDYVKKTFMNNGGRAIKAAIQVQTGREQVAKAQASKDKITITILPVVKTESIEGGESTLFGATQPGLPKEEGQKGENITVFILEGSINLKLDSEFKGVEKEQAIGVVTGHELEHATSENKVGHGDAKEERAASKIDSRMKTEFRELNKTKNSK